MAKVIALDPHDAAPTGGGDYILVVGRFKDNEPGRIIVEVTISRSDTGIERGLAQHPDGRDLTFREAVQRAELVASRVGIRRIYTIDRTNGRLEHDVLERGGRRTMEKERFQDFVTPGEELRR